MKRIFISLTLFLYYGFLSAQQPTIDFTIHARVDTTKKNIREIVSLWEGYLSSQPDSIYDNPFWNSAEKKMYKDFDLTRKFIYQFPSKQLLNYYTWGNLQAIQPVVHYKNICDKRGWWMEIKKCDANFDGTLEQKNYWKDNFYLSTGT